LRKFAKPVFFHTVVRTKLKPSSLARELGNGQISGTEGPTSALREAGRCLAQQDSPFSQSYRGHRASSHISKILSYGNILELLTHAKVPDSARISWLQAAQWSCFIQSFQNCSDGELKATRKVE
jgi:hypothetical protein